MSGASRLLVDVVFGFEALEQALELGLVRIRGGAERLRHFLGGCGEVALVRVDARNGHVADPVVRILLRNLRIKLESALRVSGPLQAASINVKLNGVGLLKRCCEG